MTHIRVIWHGEKRQLTKLSEIGKTPLIEIRCTGHAPIFAKAEFLNPTGSHKDRAYLQMIIDLEQSGELKAGMTLVDYTTGNGGASLAFVGREKGYSVVAVMPDNMTIERKQQIGNYGARLVLTPACDYVRGARATAEKIVRETDKSVLVNQSDNPGNRTAFYSIPQEIIAALSFVTPPISIRAFVGAIGTGGSITGIAEIYRKAEVHIPIIGFESLHSASSLAAKLSLPFSASLHTLVGTSPGKVAVNTDLELIDHIEAVDERNISEARRELEALDLNLGYTSHAAYNVAKKIARIMGEGINSVATMFYDAGWKYESER